MVIALKTKDRVIVATTIVDSIDDISTCDKSIQENLPYWKVRGTKDCFVFVDELKYSADVLRFHDFIFKNITDGNSIITDVVPKMKMVLDGYFCTHDGKEWDSRLIIVKGTKIYTIDRNFVVCEADEFAAHNYEYYISGAMEECPDLPPEQRILFAVNHVCEINNAKLYPLTLVDTKTKKHKVIYQ